MPTARKGPAAKPKRRPLVVVVDDEREVCDAISMALRSVRFNAAAYTDAARFLDEVHQLDAACVLLDVRMPHYSGLEVQQELNRRGIDTPVIFVSGHGDIPMAMQAARAGALHFIEKPFRDRVLIDAVREAVAEAARRRMAGATAMRARARVDAMTPREREVSELVAAGHSAAAIAARLRLSPRTVEMHKLRAMRRLQVSSGTELTRIIVEAKLAAPASARQDAAAQARPRR